MKGKGTREQMINIRIIMEKEYNIPLYMCFIDYAKAFDCVNHQLLWKRHAKMGEELEEVKSFVYLGSIINTEVSCMPEVNRRLCMARSTIENTCMTTIWKSQAICKSLKLCIARATAFAVAIYGCESWAYSKKVNKKIEAF